MNSVVSGVQIDMYLHTSWLVHPLSFVYHTEVTQLIKLELVGLFWPFNKDIPCSDAAGRSQWNQNIQHPLPVLEIEANVTPMIPVVFIFLY